jgi:homoserine dehydrogenase
MRRVSIGLLGFGGVGQAVARACVLGRDRLRTCGLDFSVTHALVRDKTRPRAFDGDRPVLIDDPATFFGHRYDVIVEVLGGVDPAAALVSRALAGGTPVVTANKSLVAARGHELQRLAAEAGVPVRLEACALAGVPFIGSLARRPLVAALSRLSGVLNGTSNFIVTAMAREHVPFGQALRRAQDLGLAEPNPSNDVSGIDAAEKLALLVTQLGVRTLAPDGIETIGIDGLDPADLEQARAFGGVIRPVAHARFDGEVTEAFVGPAFVDGTHPLASVEGRLNGIRLDGPFVDDLFFSGPGAGPDITAATIVDDIVEVVAERANRHEVARPAARPGPTTCRAPVTPWFVRVRRGTGASDEVRLGDRLAARGVRLRRRSTWTGDAERSALYALTEPCSRGSVERALAALDGAAAGASRAWRVLEP